MAALNFATTFPPNRSFEEIFQTVSVGRVRKMVASENASQIFVVLAQVWVQAFLATSMVSF